MQLEHLLQLIAEADGSQMPMWLVGVFPWAASICSLWL